MTLRLNRVPLNPVPSSIYVWSESQSTCVISMNTGVITSGRCLPLEVGDDSGEDASFAVIEVFVPGTTACVPLPQMHCERCEECELSLNANYLETSS